MTSIHCVQLRVGFAFQYDKTKTRSYLTRSQFSFYYLKGMTDMLFPNLSVISTQYTKTVDGVKGALRISFAIYLRATRKFCAPSRCRNKLVKIIFLCYIMSLFLHILKLSTSVSSVLRLQQFQLARNKHRESPKYRNCVFSGELMDLFHLLRIQNYSKLDYLLRFQVCNNIPSKN